jgi:C4-dicarboxylate-specific signal transduction histidine kinase
VTEKVLLVDLIEDALRINAGALTRHQVKVIRDFQAQPTLTLERHKVLQVLVNLVQNAKHACDESGRMDKAMTVRVTQDDRVKITVADNGVGIPQENLTRIFSHGFTTKKNGHGFGLHSGALVAKELGGALVVQSEGYGKGAAFTLELPLDGEAS